MPSENLLLQAVKTIRGRRVLVCPLNWGLGHATRCVPIIYELINQKKEVILAADGLPFEFLKREFPQLKIIRFSGIQVEYGNSNSQIIVLAKKIPTFLKNIAAEHRQIRQIIAENGIETVISDNRFGLWNRTVETIYITHQLMVKMPKKLRFLEPFVWLAHRWFITKYNSCWIPDIAGEGNLSGDLAHRYPLPKNAIFVGWLSRFKKEKSAPISAIPYQVVALISGPEPQRTIFEQEIVNYLIKKKLPSLIVRGIPSENSEKTSVGNIDFLSHVASGELQNLIFAAQTLICRSGYSSLMDLKTVGKTAILVPTPGQTEQEYLAEKLAKEGFKVLKQSELANN